MIHAEPKVKCDNKHVKDYLDYYCDFLHIPSYAVLLKGEWGAGKTWFIKKYCEELKSRKQKYIYVSLYGMTNLSEIGDAFFQQLHPILSSKGMAITTQILKGFLKGTLKIDLNGDQKGDGTVSYQIPDINLPNYLKDTDKNILIFDDLERCKIDIENILGYINYFVEHQSLKVIIIANEEELLKQSNDNKYKAIKEKLIGKTFDIRTDLDGALEEFICNVSDNSLKKFLLSKVAVIQNLYNKAEYKNLRSLQQIIWDFERIFLKLPDKAKQKSDLLQDLLRLLIAFSIEIKRGNMLPRDIGKLREQYVSMAVSRVKKQDNLDQTSNSHQKSIENTDSLQDIIPRYAPLALYDPFPNELWWQSFFDKGIVDIEELEQGLSSSIYFQDENTPSWSKLWHFHDLEDDEFDELLEDVVSKYDSKQFSKLGEIKQIVGILIKFSDIGLYNKSRKDIIQDAKTYIDSLENTEESCTVNSYFSFHQEYKVYGGLGFYSLDTEEIQELFKYIDMARERAARKNMPNISQKLLDIMQEDVWKFYQMVHLSNSEQNIYYDVPVFSYMCPEAFVKAFLLLKIKNKHVVGYAFSERYKIKKVNQKLSGEKDWLERVKSILSNEIRNREYKISKYNLERFIHDYLEPAIKKLEL